MRVISAMTGNPSFGKLEDKHQLTGFLKIMSGFSKVQGVTDYQKTFNNKCILSILLVMHAPGKSTMAYGFLLTPCLFFISMFVQELNPEKTKVIIFSRSLLARKAELNLTLYGEPLKIYPQVKFLGVIFDSKLTFQKHFEDILERCNHRYYHRLRLLAKKKWGPSPATLIQIYKQCIRPIFEYGSLSTITASDSIISKIQRLQNKFIRLALRLLKYILPKLLHDSTGLPFVKDRLLTSATKSLDRIAQNPLVEASISSHRHKWDRFPTPLSVVRAGDS